MELEYAENQGAFSLMPQGSVKSYRLGQLTAPGRTATAAGNAYSSKKRRISARPRTRCGSSSGRPTMCESSTIASLAAVTGCTEPRETSAESVSRKSRPASLRIWASLLIGETLNGSRMLSPPAGPESG